MRCPFKKDVVKLVGKTETVFGYCYKEECMAYKVKKLSQSESVCYCALMVTPNIPYSFGGHYSGND